MIEFLIYAAYCLAVLFGVVCAVVSAVVLGLCVYGFFAFLIDAGRGAVSRVRRFVAVRL